MSISQHLWHLLLPTIIFILITVNSCSGAATFTFINKCTYTVWPGILSGSGTTQLSSTGFILQPGGSTAVSAPTHWSGRMWARTQCSTNSTTGNFSCLTGDCGSGAIQCTGGATPPATLAEFTLDGSGGLDFYDVSLVDGYNLPLIIVPQGGDNCSSIGCYVDLNESCPLQLQVTPTPASSGRSHSVACKSACEAFGSPQYCCTGAYDSSSSCKPGNYSRFFKSACPTAYSYAYDDATSTFTCGGADYVITFCPSLAATKKSTGVEQTSEASPPISSVSNPTYYFVTSSIVKTFIYNRVILFLTLISLSVNLL